jgi:K+-sensing histidine kinase KdpD
MDEADIAVMPATRSHADAQKDASASETLAVVVHELRTPIATLMTSISLLLSDFDQLDRKQAADMLRRMERSAIWLQGLIENLTSTTLLDAGNLRLRPETISVQDCVEQILPVVQPILDRKGQSVWITPKAAHTFLVVDPRCIGQVLANLLINASRYSIAGDVIELHVSARGMWAEIRVTDHGPGIAEADRARIFQRYERGASAEENGSGLGLGLHIVKQLVERHGGTVGVDSTPGEGASFWVKLPTAAAERAGRAPRPMPSAWWLSPQETDALHATAT